MGKIMKDKQIVEEKARQEEQKRLELENIRMSIRKKISSQTSKEETNNNIVENGDHKMEVDENIICRMDESNKESTESESRVKPMDTDDEEICTKPELDQTDDEVVQLEEKKLELEEVEILREEEKRKIEEEIHRKEEEIKFKKLEEERLLQEESERLKKIEE